MAFQNLTPFPSISWENVNTNKQWYITTLVRVKYLFHRLEKGKWELRLTPEQGDLFGEDIFYNDNLDFPIRYESDFVIHKPNTDIILNAKAQDAQNLNIKNQCSMVITDSANKPIKQKNMNLHGKHPWIDGSEKKKNYPAGLGFVSREENSRLKHAGTYDKDWIEQQHPYPPHDYNHYYNQAAHPDLILKGYLPAGAKFGLNNLLSTQRDTFKIPELHCICEHSPKNGETHKYLMNIDTVLIDIDSADEKDWAVYLSYRHYQQKLFEPKETLVKYLPATNQLEINHGG